ncbi:hypothetical protein pipiens_000700, partial [Culex pipiens pipiens]
VLWTSSFSFNFFLQTYLSSTVCEPFFFIESPFCVTFLYIPRSARSTGAWYRLVFSRTRFCGNDPDGGTLHVVLRNLTSNSEPILQPGTPRVPCSARACC